MYQNPLYGYFSDNMNKINSSLMINCGITVQSNSIHTLKAQAEVGTTA